MWWLLFILLAVVFLAVYNGTNNAQSREANSTFSFDPHNDKNFKLGAYKTVIRGIKYRNIEEDITGEFAGYAEAKTDNPHDEDAVEIHMYNKYLEDIHIGFAPKGSSVLHQSIIDRGGIVYCRGVIRRGDENLKVLLGDVYVDFDEKYWLPKSDNEWLNSNSIKPIRYFFHVDTDNVQPGKFYGYIKAMGREGDLAGLKINNGELDIGMIIFDYKSGDALLSITYNVIDGYKNKQTMAFGYIQKVDGKNLGYVYISLENDRCDINKEIEIFKEKRIRYTV